VRKLCAQCRVRHEPSVREIEELAAEYCEGTPFDPEPLLRKWRQDKIAMYEAKGCKACERTGYQGRLAVYELIVADAGVKRLVQTRAPVTEIAAAAAAGGMRTLKQAGIDKVIKGYTDMHQVRAV
jgi:type II secretory ATPase GspE/PulE/Tfp pilus assembly ATPase PilB-like protein